MAVERGIFKRLKYLIVRKSSTSHPLLLAWVETCGFEEQKLSYKFINLAPRGRGRHIGKSICNLESTQSSRKLSSVRIHFFVRSPISFRPGGWTLLDGSWRVEHRFIDSNTICGDPVKGLEEACSYSALFWCFDQAKGRYTALPLSWYQCCWAIRRGRLQWINFIRGGTK